MRPLFEITQDTKRLQDAIEADTVAGGEASHLAFAEWAASLTEEAGKKLDGYVSLVKRLEYEAVAATAEMEQWKMKAQSRKATIEWLKEKMKRHLEVVGVDELTTEKGLRLCLTKNGGKVPVEFDQSKVEDMTAEEKAKFLDMIPMVNQTAVRKTLEAGEELSFAKLGVVGSHLRIR